MESVQWNLGGEEPNLPFSLIIASGQRLKDDGVIADFAMLFAMHPTTRGSAPALMSAAGFIGEAERAIYADPPDLREAQRITNVAATLILVKLFAMSVN